MVGQKKIMKRASVVELKKLGYSSSIISQRTGVGVRTVNRTTKRWKETESLDDRPRSGRTPKLNKKVCSKIVDLLTDKKCGSTRKAKAVLARRGISLSLTSIRNGAKRAGKKHVKGTVKPLLTRAHRRKRLAFVQRHLKCKDFSETRVFSDEKLFVSGDVVRSFWIDKDQKSPFVPRSKSSPPI